MESSLSGDLARILNDPSFSDVVLVTKDAHRVPACRILLAARSPVFHAMFLNSMAESRLAEVPLPTITSSALLALLEFLYTDTLSQHPLTVDTFIDVLHAARYFLVVKLEQLALSFFNQLPRDCLSHQAAMYLSRAVDLLSPQSDVSIFYILVDVLKTANLHSDHVQGFSREALLFYLQKTRNPAVRFSLSEYNRLVCVLLWCAFSVSPEAPEILSDYFPVENLVMEQVRSPGGPQLALLETLKAHKSSLAANFRCWLPFLDLFRIHPEILARLVQPLDIIPPSYLAHVFRFQAMYSKDMLLLRWKEGAHGPRYVIHEEGCTIESTCIGKSFGFARAEMSVTRTMGLYEWDFVVERTCPHLGLGFIAAEALPRVEYEGSWLGYKYYGWVLCCTGDLLHHAKTFDEGKVEYGQSFGNESRVRVHLNMTMRTCSFTINGQRCGVAWEDIPTEVYPAVTLRSPGRVRLEPVADVDKQELLELLDGE